MPFTASTGERKQRARHSPGCRREIRGDLSSEFHIFTPPPEMSIYLQDFTLCAFVGYCVGYTVRCVTRPPAWLFQ